jgi:hypothetical protein
MAALLNEYQIQFLRLLVAHGVRFLIIGGQARHIYSKAPTRDLDIWADILDASKNALENALVEWSSTHPNHSDSRIEKPAPLRPGVQIKFPDADAAYLDSKGTLQTITASDGIDILTSIGHAIFTEYYERAATTEVNGITVRVPIQSDLENLKSPDTKS